MKDQENIVQDNLVEQPKQDIKNIILKAKIKVVHKHIKLALSTMWLSIEIALFFVGLLFYVSPSDFINIHHQLLDQRVITTIVGLILFSISIVRFTVLYFKFVHIPKYDLYKSLYCLVFSIVAIFISHIWVIIFGWVVITLMITIFDLYQFNEDYQDRQKVNILGKPGDSKEALVDYRTSENRDSMILVDPEVGKKCDAK